MKVTIKNAEVILGQEIVKAFNESCLGNKHEVEALIEEALKALQFVRINKDWSDHDFITTPNDIND
jgi:hypothetical protein